MVWRCGKSLGTIKEYFGGGGGGPPPFFLWLSPNFQETFYLPIEKMGFQGFPWKSLLFPIFGFLCFPHTNFRPISRRYRSLTQFFPFFLVFELLLPNGVLYGPKNQHLYGGVSWEDTAATTKHNSKPFLRISIFREGVVGPVWPIPAMCKMCFFVISRPFMREMASYLLVTSQIVPSYGG